MSQSIHVDTILLSTLRRRATKPDLYKHAEELQKHIDLNVLVPPLQRERLLTDDEAYILTNANSPPGERIQKLLTFVIRKGEDGPEKFVECIASTACKTRGHAYLIKNVLGVRHEQELNEERKSQFCSIQENERKARMSEKFAYLLTKAAIQLQNTDMPSFGVYVSNLPSSKNDPDQSILRSDKELIQGARTPVEIFHVLTNGNYWGYSEPFLLYTIVKRFGSKELVREVETYHRQLKQFESDPSFMPTELPPEVQKMAKNVELSEMYASMVTNVEKEFEELDVLDSLKVFATLLPMEYGQMEQPHSDAIASASSVSSVFGILGYYWDWQRFRPLKCIVETLGTIEVQRMASEYDHEFQSRVPRQQPGHYETPAVETEVFDYRIQFARLVLSTMMYLEQGNITLDEFCTFLVSRLAACFEERHIAMLRPAIYDVENWSDTFLILNRCWDHFNFKLLHEVLENFQIQEILQQLFCYRQDIHSFAVTTKLSVLVQALPSCHPPARLGFVKLSISFDATHMDHQFEHFKRFQQSLTKEFDIPEYAVQIYTIKFHTIGTKLKQYHYRMKCYIPSAVASLLIMESKVKRHFYKQHQITHLKLHEEKQYYIHIPVPD